MIESLFSENPLFVIIGGMNVLCFALMGIDKMAAKIRFWRISEKILMTVAVLLGAIGGCCGMWLFHHKTKKGKFKIGLPALAVFQAFLIYLILTTNWQSYV